MPCNSGVSLIPVINGTFTEFAARGLHNGLVLLGDKQTHSYWDHITGECVHGDLKGQQLAFTDFDLLYTTVAGALITFPQAQLAPSDGLPTRGRFMKWVSRFYHAVLGNWLPPYFTKTLDPQEDLRRDRMDIGLGLWTTGTHRYYPMDVLKAQAEGILDTLDGKTVFVFYNTQTKAPDAFYIEAQAVQKQGDCYLFDTGVFFENGALCHPQGHPMTIQRPQQMFTRWYGFAYTFPNCDIYGGASL